MKIAILGFGTVGRGVAEILLKESTELTSKIEIKKILIREGRLDYYNNKRISLIKFIRPRYFYN